MNVAAKRNVNIDFMRTSIRLSVQIDRSGWLTVNPDITRFLCLGKSLPLFGVYSHRMTLQWMRNSKLFRFISFVPFWGAMSCFSRFCFIEGSIGLALQFSAFL